MLWRFASKGNNSFELLATTWKGYIVNSLLYLYVDFRHFDRYLFPAIQVIYKGKGKQTKQQQNLLKYIGR